MPSQVSWILLVQISLVHQFLPSCLLFCGMHSHYPEFEIQLDEIISPQDLHIQVRKQTVQQEINCNWAKLRMTYNFENQQTKPCGNTYELNYF